MTANETPARVAYLRDLIANVLPARIARCEAKGDARTVRVSKLALEYVERELANLTA